MIDKSFYYCFTVDIDSDIYFGNNISANNPKDKTVLGWKGFEDGKDVLSKAIEGIEDSFGRQLPITWFVRCDEQIKILYGDYCYLLKEYKGWWDRVRSLGHDIQWHAHLYRRSGSDWIQNTRCFELQRELIGARKSLNEIGIQPKAIRIGEAYQTNDLMAIVEELELKADCSAIPGRRRVDDEKSLDWLNTPNAPYRPSVIDYRREGHPSRNLWEIPMSTISTKVSYDDSSLLRYINPAFHEFVLDGIDGFIDHSDYLVSISHPYEVLPHFFSDDSLNSHPLISFNSEAIRNNVNRIVREAKSINRDIKFVTISDLIDHLDERYN